MFELCMEIIKSKTESKRTLHESKNIKISTLLLKLYTKDENRTEYKQ